MRPFMFLFIYFLAKPCDVQDLGSPTRDRSQSHGSESSSISAKS